MSKIKQSNFFKIISTILITTFITLDISWAYPPEHNTENSTLAAPSLLQQNPINEHTARFQQSVFSQGALIASVYDIGEYFFGNTQKKIGPLPSKYAQDAIRADLGKHLSDAGTEILNIVPVEYIKKTTPEKLKVALDEIGFKGTLPDEGVVFILYKNSDKKFLVQVAKNGEVSPANLPGYEWVISDKYVVKYMPQDYEASQPAPSIEAITISHALPKYVKPIIERTVLEISRVLNPKAYPDLSGISSLVSLPYIPGAYIGLKPKGYQEEQGNFNFRKKLVGEELSLYIRQKKLAIGQALFEKYREECLSVVEEALSVKFAEKEVADYLTTIQSNMFVLRVIRAFISNVVAEGETDFNTYREKNAIMNEIAVLVQERARPLKAKLVRALASHMVKYIPDEELFTTDTLTMADKVKAELEKRARDTNLTVDDLDEFLNSISSGRKHLTLVLDDNCEAVFDLDIIMDLIKINPTLKITLLPRGGNYRNDISYPDLTARLDNAYFESLKGYIAEGRIEVVADGPDMCGINLLELSEKTRRALMEADVVWSIGETNFEMLNGVRRNVYHSFVVYSTEAQTVTGLPKGSYLFVKTRAGSRYFDGYFEKSARFITAGQNTIAIAGRTLSDTLKETSKTTISEPIAKVIAPLAETERYHGIINKIFSVRAITVLSAPAAAVILAFPQFAVAASGDSAGFFSSGNIVWIIYAVAASVAVFYLMKWAKTTTINNITDKIAAKAWESTGFLNVYITNEPNAHLFLIGTITEEEPSILSSALLINAHIIKQRWFIWLWKNHNSLLREIIGVDLYQRSVFAKESEDILATLKRKGYKGEKDLGYQSAFFSEINKKAYPHIGARGAALDVWFYRIYPNPLYAEWRDDKNWIIKQARKYLAKEYSWMNDTQVWEVINEIYKIDSDYFNPKKSSTTLNFIGLFGLGPAALMSVFLAARDFAIAHPVIAGIAAFGIGVTAFFAAWRVFFSLNWHVFWLKHGGHFNVSHEEVLAKIGPLAVPYLKIALADKDSFVRSKAAEALDKIGWQPESLELKIVYLFAKQRWGALVEIGAPAIPILVTASYDRDLYVSYPAAKALDNIKYRIAAEPFIKILNDKNSSMHPEAAAALSKIGWKPETKEENIAYIVAKKDWNALAKKDAPAVPALIKLLSYHKHWYVRSKAAETLGNIRGHRTREHLIKALNDVDPYVRIAAATALDKKGWEPKTQELKIAYLFAKQDWEALVKIGAPAIPTLVKAFSDNSFFIRSEAVITSGNIKDSEAIEPLIEVLGDNNPSIRLEAAKALDKIGWEPKTEEQTIAYLFARQDWEALVEIGAPAIPILEKASCDHNWYISSPAAKALGNIKGQQGQGQGSSGALLSINPFAITIGFSVAGLASVLFGIATLGIVIAAVFIIWRIFDPVGWHIYWLKHSANKAAHEEALVIIGTSAVPSLIKLLNDKNPLIRSLAAIVLLNIKGKEESAAQRKAALEYVAASATREISQRKEISHANVFEIVRFFVPEEMEDLTNALNELKSLSKQTNVSADVISQAIAQAKEKYSLSDSETKILWLALTGPGQGMGDSLENSAKKAEINSEEDAALSTVTQLFEIVESSVNNERAEFIKAGNHLIGLIKAKAVVESAEYFPLVERVDKKMAAAGIRKGLERAISAMEGLEKEDVTPEIRNTAEFLKKNLNQFEADSATAAIIVLARRAKRNNQKLIIGLETDWIPGLDKEKSYQQNAIHTLMQEIYAVGETLKSMGLDNVEVIRGNSGDLANKLLNEADKTHTDLRNVVVMASTTTITSLSFAPLRDADENNRPFLAGIDTTEIVKFYETFGETLSNQLYIRLTQMLYMTLELAAGKEPPQTPMIVSYDSKQRIVIFLPKAEPMDYEALKSTYAAEKTALSAA